ncbi:recombinase family protein [Amycolatopsis sp. NBC_01286]|uniref:recombinase family protein n=1 Tax=Amycolatopsis sp. NBC_01286 TaxID=2903560 RepID=UPI002E0E3DC3|nr:recombinase family protein [Amycolatopsis sp. NBC_01286]
MPETYNHIKAFIYLRVARDDHRYAGRALAAQNRVCEHRANELGLTVLGAYIDRGSSSTMSRPGLTALLGELGRRDDLAFVIAYDHRQVAIRAEDYSRVVWAVGKAGAQLEIASLPHREATAVDAQLIGRIGSVQLAETGAKPPPFGEPDDDQD